MSASSPVRVVLAGWAVTVLFAVLIVVVRGQDDIVAAVVFAVLATAMGAWVAIRRSRPSLVVSLVLGLLHTLEQVAYAAATATSEPFEGDVLLADVVGLVGGVLVAVGAVTALVRARRDRRLVSGEVGIG